MDWQFFDDNSAAIQVFITFILVCITGKYVLITNNILKEQEKSRRTSFIERRLEKLYYPLKNLMKESAFVPIFDANGNRHNEFNMEKFDKILPFEYLILSNDSTNKIKEFLNKIDKAKQDENVISKGDLILEIIRAKNVQVIKEIIDQDIQILQEELDRLV